MPDATPQSKPDVPRTVALIVAAGKGLRAGGDLPKQFALYDGKPLLRHSAEAFVNWGKTARVFVAIGEGQHGLATETLKGLDGVELVTGGAERVDSVRLGLVAITASGGADRVFIHDAARPGLTSQVLDRLSAALDTAPGAIPVLPVVDSITRGTTHIEAAVDRNDLRRVQTPQAFAFPDILAAHRAWPSDKPATDDSEIAHASGLSVALVEGDEALKKITFAEDMAHNMAMTATNAATITRTGMGFDVHRLVAGAELWLGGVRIPHDKGLEGHSDADVALHAITDAVLGAMALGDIGEHFPPSDPQWRGADSSQFLAHAAKLMRDKGGEIANIDLTIICEAPKIGSHKAAIQVRIASILGVQPDQVGVKATTTERLGFTGRGEGIAAQAIASIMVAG